MKITTAAPTPTSTYTAPSGLTAKQQILDALVKSPPPVPALMQRAAVSVARTDSVAAVVGTAAGALGALAGGLGPAGMVASSLLGGLTGLAVGHSLSRYGQILNGKHEAHQEKVAFAGHILEESGMCDGQVRDYGSALVVTKGSDLLAHFKDSGDFLVARSLSPVGTPFYDSKASSTLFDSSGKTVSSTHKGSALIAFDADKGELTLTDVRNYGKPPARYNLRDRTIQSEFVTIEKGVVTQYNGHRPGLSLPAYNGHGQFDKGLLLLEPEVFGAFGTAGSLDAQGGSRQAIRENALAGIESCLAQCDGHWLYYEGRNDTNRNAIATKYVDSIYESTQDKDVRALIDFARSTSKPGKCESYGTPGKTMLGVLTSLADSKPEASRADLFKKAGLAAGGYVVAEAFLKEIASQGDAKTKSLVHAALTTETEPRDSLDGTRNKKARQAAFHAALEALQRD